VKSEHRLLAEDLVAYPERRSAQRFRIKLPLMVRWTSGSNIGEASTESQDVSSRGIYFSLPKFVQSGSPVEIVLTLPHEITLAGPVRVRCLGRIQRNEQQQPGFAGLVAEIERYEFLRNDEHAA
jgi:PilZ domain-containing protein